ncbi:MAG: hypothetical protein ACREVK_05810 [Gammaproteobacteria bacterium]
MEFSVESTEGCYAFIQATLDKFGYGRDGWPPYEKLKSLPNATRFHV